MLNKSHGPEIKIFEQITERYIHFGRYIAYRRVTANLAREAVSPDLGPGNARLGIDVLGGVRYNSLEVDLGVQVTLLGLTAAASRNRTEDWADGVVGVRAQYGGSRGWGASGWADIGKGSDSSSYQLAGFVNYRFENNVNLFGGYRHLSVKWEDGSGASFIELDLEYSGPMLGVSYRF